jgi:YD repeat-containing protein
MYGSTLTATTGGVIPAGSGATSASVTVPGLDCNSTYFYRAKGVNANGTTYGGPQSFTTSACVSGACGSDNGLSLVVAPTNLCATGTPTSVSTSPATYDWSCIGGFGQLTATCSAIRNYAVTSSVDGVTATSTGHGTIDASTAVGYAETPSFTLTPDDGYFAAPITGTCGGVLSGNKFKVNPVTANCTVIASFASIVAGSASFVNASTSTNKTSIVRLVNTTDVSSVITATAYDEAGKVVGVANTSLGTIQAQQMLTFTSQQLETSIGYTPSTSTAKYRIFFSSRLTSLEVVNFIKDIASGNLTLAQAQSKNGPSATGTSSVANILYYEPSTNSSRTSVIRLVNTSNQTGQVSATAFGETGNIPGTLNASLGSIAPQQMLTFTSAQLELAIGFTPSSPGAKYRIAFGTSLPSFELVNFIKETATGNVTLGQAQVDSRAAGASTPSTRNALLINASTNSDSTSIVRLLNLDFGSGAITATAYNEAGAIVGKAGSVLGMLGSNQAMTLSSAQLEAALGYTPTSGIAKYRIVFNADVPTFELVNFLAKVTGGSLTLGQMQTDSRIASSATTVTRNVLFANSSTSPNKTSVVRLINLGDQSGSVSATAYNEAGSMVGAANTVVATIAGQQMLTFTSAQLESILGFTPSAPTAKYRIVFKTSLPSFDLVNYVVDVATGSVTLGQVQID